MSLANRLPILPDLNDTSYSGDLEAVVQCGLNAESLGLSSFLLESEGDLRINVSSGRCTGKITNYFPSSVRIFSVIMLVIFSRIV